MNLIKVKAEYIALRERELELDEIAYILDLNTLPKQTRTKLKFPNVEDLRKKIDDLFHLEVEEGAGKSLIFLDKLSDKSSGLSGRLVHQLRVEGRKLEALLAELRSRADLQQQVSGRQVKSNDYLKREVARLKRELDIAREEILFLRASSSPSGHSLPIRRRGVPRTL